METEPGTTPDQPLAGETRGEGPPLIAIHGEVLGGRLTFGGVHDEWARSFTVTVVDRPGFEMTGGDPTSVQVQAARLVATLEEVAGDEPAHLVAHGGAGIPALLAAGAAPERVATLVLIETPARGLCPPKTVQPDRWGAEVLRLSRLTDPRERSRGLLELMDPGFTRALSSMLDRIDEPGITDAIEDLLGWETELDRDGLAAAFSDEHPVGVIAVSGTESEATFRTFGQCTAAALMGRHLVIEGAGHAAHLHPGFRDILGELR